MITNPLLKTYWIESPAIHSLGFGVTAFSRDDAFQLLSASGYALRSDDPSIRVATSAHVASAVYALGAFALTRLRRRTHD